MTIKTLDDVMRQMLNDSDLFYIRYTIFDNAKWQKLGSSYQKGDFDALITEINDRISTLKKEANSQREDGRKSMLQESIKLAESLKSAINNKPRILGQMFSTLGKFGLVKCHLPKMEDYGKVIENHDRSIVEQFFLYKIDKAKAYEKRALRKTLEYLRELYAMNLDILEIAFFIRKLNSLTQFIEVIKDE